MEPTPARTPETNPLELLKSVFAPRPRGRPSKAATANILSLPDDILRMIVAKVPAKDLHALARTSKRFNAVLHKLGYGDTQKILKAAGFLAKPKKEITHVSMPPEDEGEPHLNALPADEVRGRFDPQTHEIVIVRGSDEPYQFSLKIKQHQVYSGTRDLLGAERVTIKAPEEIIVQYRAMVDAQGNMVSLNPKEKQIVELAREEIFDKIQEIKSKSTSSLKKMAR